MRRERVASKFETESVPDSKDESTVTVTTVTSVFKLLVLLVTLRASKTWLNDLLLGRFSEHLQREVDAGEGENQ